MIETLKQLVEESRELREEDFYSLIGIHQIQAISDLIKGYEQLEKENKELKATLKCTQDSWFKDTKKIEELKETVLVANKLEQEIKKLYIPKSVIREKIEELERDEEKIRAKKKGAHDSDRSKARMRAYLTKTIEIKNRLKELLGDE